MERHRHSVLTGGMTLIEILLVISIIGIMMIVTMPQMARSLRGNRLRTAGMSIVRAGRYARSMAVMRQQNMALRMNISKSTIEVGDAGPPRPRADVDIGNDMLADLSAGALEPHEPNVASNVAVQNIVLSRRLGGVQIEYVETDDGHRLAEGTCSIEYARNGRCAVYSVKLVDQGGEHMIVTVDGLANASTEYGRW